MPPLSLSSSHHLHFRPTCILSFNSLSNHVIRPLRRKNKNGGHGCVQSLCPGISASLLLGLEKLVLRYGAPVGSVKLQNMLQGSSSLYSLLPSFEKSSSGQACRHPRSQVLDTDGESLNLNQSWMVKRLSAAVLLANALVMAAPFEALAETCEADNSFFNMPLLLSVALIGATVGGLLARQRKAELQRVNEQLRQINAALRRQAKIESYAPALSYAPASARISESEVIVDPRKHELISRLKSGKNYLRNQNPEKALEEFKEALQLAQNLNDPTEEKKAARGLGASLQRQGKYREAIKYHSMVLSVSEREGEDSGNAEAYGAIADCYTELGELEKAGKFYDQYIARLQTD